jgi:hypothetical protein
MREGKRDFGQQIEMRCWESLDARTATPTRLSWVQSFVPGRDMSLVDGIANTLGVIAGMVLFWFRGQHMTRTVARFIGE